MLNEQISTTRTESKIEVADEQVESEQTLLEIAPERPVQREQVCSQMLPEERAELRGVALWPMLHEAGDHLRPAAQADEQREMRECAQCRLRHASQLPVRHLRRGLATARIAEHVACRRCVLIPVIRHQLVYCTNHLDIKLICIFIT